VIYEAVFERAGDGGVWAYVPDLSGCTSWGKTLDEALENVREAIGLWLENARAAGEQAPRPATIAAMAIEGPAA